MRNGMRRFFAAGLALALLAPAAGFAKEESKINLSMEKLAAGTEKGMLRSQLSPSRATLRIHVNHLAPNLEHIVMGDGVEVERFTTNGSGSAEVRIDLLATGSGTTPSFDPRGKFVTVNDGTKDVLAAWVYGDPADDPSRTRIKEVTQLARDATVTEGRVDARYDALPSGGARLLIAMRGGAPGDYDVLVDDVLVASVTTNASGFASVDLRVRPGGGMSPSPGGKPHKQKGPLTLNPRSALIEVEQAGVVHFSGEMLAQIPGLGVCTASSMSADLTLDPAQTMGSGSVTLGIEASCDVQLTVAVADLAAGDYDLLIAGTAVAVITVPDAGSGTGSATVVYDENPESGEQPLPAGVAAGASVEIRSGTTTVLTGTLP